MVDKTFLHWPFFGDEHRDVRLRLKEFISRELCVVDHGNIDQACKKYSNPSWFKQNLMAGSRVMSISWLGCGQHHG